MITAAEAYNPIAALDTATSVIAVTTSSAEVDITTLEIGTPVSNGRLLRMRAEGDVWYNFGTTPAGSVNEATVTGGGATQADWIPAGDFIDIRVPYVRSSGGVVSGLAKYLRVKAPIACKLRLSISSEALANR